MPPPRRLAPSPSHSLYHAVTGVKYVLFLFPDIGLRLVVFTGMHMVKQISIVYFSQSGACSLFSPVQRVKISINHFQLSHAPTASGPDSL